jgi:hypothetical protein
MNRIISDFELASWIVNNQPCYKENIKTYLLDKYGITSENTFYAAIKRLTLIDKVIEKRGNLYVKGIAYDGN